MFRLVPIIILFCLVASANAAWSFSWSTRTDIAGKPAGIFTTTPYPLDENSTTYSITNDEGATTFTLGTLYFVDGAKANDSGDGLSLATAKKTIGAGITAAGSGNKTVLIRGAHDAFDGTYSITGETHPLFGTANTTRFTICGYGQERPILNYTGAGTTDSGFHVNTSGNAFVTLQRLKIQSYPGRGIYSGEGADYVNLIDVWIYACARDAYVGGGYAADGNVHWIAGNNGWIYHCTSEHTYGKGYKISDGVNDWIIEWSVANETGYWSGVPNNSAVHAYAFDFATDNGNPNSDLTLRYCISGTASYGTEFRDTANISCHHNEFYDSIHYDSGPGDYAAVSGLHLLDLGDHNLCGEVYANVFRDNTDANYPYLLTLDGLNCATATKVYNNLFYGSPMQLWHRLRSSNPANLNILIENNTFYGPSVTGGVYSGEHTSDEWNTTDGLIRIDNVHGTSANSYLFKNNIVYTTSTGKCVDFAGIAYITKNNNLYYYPSGSRGYSDPLETDAVEDNPLFQANPSGNYSITSANISSSSPARGAGVDLSGTFITDLIGTTRNSWDIGAYEYLPPSHILKATTVHSQTLILR